jgi:hypothetical protein
MVTVLLPLLLAATPPDNVVLITWDGVRWQDFFDRTAGGPMQRFWSKHAARATVLGEPSGDARFEVANDSLVSLPGYQEMMVGGPVPCLTNLCGRVRAETLVDRLVKEGLSSRVVASWGSIADAASTRDQPFVDAGRHPEDPRAPWGGARLDRGTWAKAMTALEQRPRFLWISLNDADEWGHRGRRETYVLTLRRYDIWLDELLEKLGTMGDYGARTTVIVTTDHGRGDGDAWTEHGWEHPGSRQIFAFAIGPGTGARAPAGRYDHRWVRPTIEALLGLPTSQQPLPAVVPDRGVGTRAVLSLSSGP